MDKHPDGATLYLLTIHGKLAPANLEAARKLHNETAGADANIAAARSLGDLSHVVFSPSGSTSEICIFDQWNDLNGLNQFFANPHVQEQGGRIFASREPVVWAPANDFVSFHLPAPADKHERGIGLIRGTVKSRAEARALLDAMETKILPKHRRLGKIGHEVYFRLTPPGEPASLELLGVDTWASVAGMKEAYADPELRALGAMFAGAPMTATLERPAGAWVEW